MGQAESTQSPREGVHTTFVYRENKVSASGLDPESVHVTDL
jgi:hypothetical protein